MRQRYDLAGISFIFAGAAVFAAVAIKGPIPVTYEVIKDFQPLGAALIALGAATLAYRGAIKKITFDRHEADQARRTTKLIIALRLEQATRRLVDRVLKVASHIQDMVNIVEEFAQRAELRQDEIAIDDDAEFEEAWARLDLLPSA